MYLEAHISNEPGWIHQSIFKCVFLKSYQNYHVQLETHQNGFDTIILASQVSTSLMTDSS